MRGIGAAIVVLVACSRPKAVNPGSDADADAAPVATTTASAPPPMNVPAGATACAGPGCLRFDSAEDAFRYVVAQTNPVVLAIGEAHAQKGTEAITSSTKRFTENLLPIVAPKATDVVVELWAPDPSCQKAVAETAAAQKPVVQAQAETNQNEYLTLGTKAKALGMTPWLLKPTCNDFYEIADAGDDRIATMLGTVKKLTQQRIVQLLRKNAGDGGDPKLVLAYGGAMHNDLAPDPDTKEFSFGPDLATFTHERYTELDLIVPEYVKDTPIWVKLPWYAAFKADKIPAKKATLYQTGKRSFTIVFPPST